MVTETVSPIIMLLIKFYKREDMTKDEIEVLMQFGHIHNGELNQSGLRALSENGYVKK